MFAMLGLPADWALILGGLIYGKLTIFLHFYLDEEPGPRFVFNIAVAVAGVAVGVTAKADNLRRGGRARG